MWFAQSTLRMRDVFPRLTERAFTPLVASRGAAARRRVAVGCRRDGADSRRACWSSGCSRIRSRSRAARHSARRSCESRRRSRSAAASFAGSRIRSFGSRRACSDNHLVQWESAVSMQPGRGFVSVSVRHAPGLGGTQLSARRLVRARSRSSDRAHVAARRGSGRRRISRRPARWRSGRCGTRRRSSTAGSDSPAWKVTCSATSMATERSARTTSPSSDVTVRIGGLVTRTDCERPLLAVERASVSGGERADRHALARGSRRGCRRCRRARCVRRRSSSRAWSSALVRTREIIGQLVPGARIAMPAGVGLELRDVDGGALNTTRTLQRRRVLLQPSATGPLSARRSRSRRRPRSASIRRRRSTWSWARTATTSSSCRRSRWSATRRVALTRVRFRRRSGSCDAQLAAGRARDRSARGRRSTR